ncbi:hypothetical protein [Crenothrix polyspora]|uniref:Uncharacterized protein n=1 Tax=Crenothrix polyspora TaxID=360316 RepID=A0A1R4H4W9_9GAMM|nr:hypothetical protein [Crenothrix polyspora]SJM91303.1 conserved hypothetical protein [Crenothrix polyspora]
MENISNFQSITQNFDSNDTLDTRLGIEGYYANTQISRYLKQAEEDDYLTLVGLHQLAKSIGVINSEKITHKVELIRNIQKAINCQPCFRSEIRNICYDNDCNWQKECKKMIAEWYR